MRCSHLMMLIVVLPVLLSSLEIQLVEGIKCYVCAPCDGKGEEQVCEVGFDSCTETTKMTASNPQIARFCSDNTTQAHAKEAGLVCEEFRPVAPGSTTLVKQCFCHADLCNDGLPTTATTTPGSSATQETNDASLIIGFSTLPHPVFVSCSTYFLFKGFFQ